MITGKEVAFKYRQGHQWIVESYDPDVKTWRESEPMSYMLACLIIREIKDSWDTKAQSYKEEIREL